MGPRPFGRGRPTSLRRGLVGLLSLQWGRDLSVAEGAGLDGPRRSRHGASMGPRPFGRGRRRPRAALPCLCGLLQWGRDLSVAEGGGPPAGSRRGIECFNGAATFRSRKADLYHLPGQAWRASMGPRPFGRGRQTDGARTPAHMGGFNGAATFRSQKASGHANAKDRRKASMGPRPFGRGRGGLPCFP